jgi:hypothetical protein
MQHCCIQIDQRGAGSEGSRFGPFTPQVVTGPSCIFRVGMALSIEIVITDNPPQASVLLGLLMRPRPAWFFLRAGPRILGLDGCVGTCSTGRWGEPGWRRAKYGWLAATTRRTSRRAYFGGTTVWSPSNRRVGWTSRLCQSNTCLRHRASSTTTAMEITPRYLNHGPSSLGPALSPILTKGTPHPLLTPSKPSRSRSPQLKS